MTHFDIEWIDRGQPPRAKPNPRFPKGIDLDVTHGKEPYCVVKLPYPTGHINVGLWMIRCRQCHIKAAITAASRPDDPRTVRMPCKTIKQ